jgi:RNA polymerase sigma-70 factor, ECF subfamily
LSSFYDKEKLEPANNDIVLFNRIKDDDRSALNELFLTYYHRLCIFANSYLHHSGEAEEVVSDVFFAIWKNRDQLDVDRSLKAYLYTSVKHGCIAALRKHHPELESDHEVLALLEIIDLASPAGELEYKELQQHVDKAVELLPPACRQIFVMSRFDGLRYREIATILGISEKTVENQLVKALSVIRQSVRQYQADSDSIRAVNS